MGKGSEGAFRRADVQLFGDLISKKGHESEDWPLGADRLKDFRVCRPARVLNCAYANTVTANQRITFRFENGEVRGVNLEDYH